MSIKVESLAFYDVNDPMTVMQVEDKGEVFRFHIVTTHGNKTIDLDKASSFTLESYLRNRRAHLKEQQVH